MAAVVVCGGGACGLTAAMLLAADGHEVTVLERDPMGPPDPSDAWDAWERRGVNQFRLPHFLLPRWRFDLARELPRVVEALEAAGGYAFNFFGPFRDVIPEPERFDCLTARRPVLDAVLSQVAETTPGVTIRRGAGIEGVETGPSVRAGIPHVTGVRLEGGEVVPADLVVSATGRRSALGSWLEAAGARPIIEEEEDSGFVYFGRYIRSFDGSQLVQSVGMRDFGSIALLSLPADGGTAGIGLIACTGDAPLRKLKDDATWERVLRRIPGGDGLLESEHISPLVTMAGIEDHYRRFVVDGEPVATGVLAVADAWAATNPTLGRGIALGTMHAIALRDTVRAHGDDPYDLALAFDEVTERQLAPWYRSTVWHDRHKVASWRAAIDGAPYETDDETWGAFERASSLLGTDVEASLSLANSTAFLAQTPLDLLASGELRAKLEQVPAPPPHDGPSRGELLELVSG